MNTTATSEERSSALNAVVADALLTTYGYRKTTELRGEFVIENHRVVSNTLHTVEVLERDRSGQPSNPLNDDDEWDADEELGVADLEERLDAAFAREDEARLNSRVQPK